MQIHLLPRIKALLHQEVTSSGTDVPLSDERVLHYPESADQHHHVLFKSGRMYKHQLLRINYTTYDVRRSQDIINPSTQRRDIMLLADDADDESHPFRYARVLGVYHVNVIYTGLDMPDYRARRLDFLWVRWFQYSDTKSMEWAAYQLDRVHFPPINSDGAFGFVDPKDIVRACQTIPSFASGKVHIDAISISKLANDAHDWRGYRVNRSVQLFLDHSRSEGIVYRFADRDMLMRFHWGLAIGHAYTHDSTWTETFTTTEENSYEVSDIEGSHPPTVNPTEFSLKEHEDHDWDNSDEEQDGDIYVETCDLRLEMDSI